MIVLRQYNHLGVVEVASAFGGRIPVGLCTPAGWDSLVGHDVIGSEWYQSEGRTNELSWI